MLCGIAARYKWVILARKINFKLKGWESSTKIFDFNYFESRRIGKRNDIFFQHANTPWY